MPPFLSYQVEPCLVQGWIGVTIGLGRSDNQCQSNPAVSRRLGLGLHLASLEGVGQGARRQLEHKQAAGCGQLSRDSAAAPWDPVQGHLPSGAPCPHPGRGAAVYHYVRPDRTMGMRIQLPEGYGMAHTCLGLQWPSLPGRCKSLCLPRG